MHHHMMENLYPLHSYIKKNLRKIEEIKFYCMDMDITGCLWTASLMLCIYRLLKITGYWRMLMLEVEMKRDGIGINKPSNRIR